MLCMALCVVAVHGMCMCMWHVHVHVHGAACSSSVHSGASEVIEVPEICERSSQWKAQPITSIVTGSAYDA